MKKFDGKIKRKIYFIKTFQAETPVTHSFSTMTKKPKSLKKFNVLVKPESEEPVENGHQCRDNLPDSETDRTIPETPGGKEDSGQIEVK